VLVVVPLNWDLEIVCISNEITLLSITEAEKSCGVVNLSNEYIFVQHFLKNHHFHVQNRDNRQPVKWPWLTSAPSIAKSQISKNFKSCVYTRS